MDPAYITYKGQQYPAKYAGFNIAAAGNSDVVAAVTGKCICVTQLCVGGDVAATLSVITFNSAATAQVPVITCVAAGPVSFPDGMQIFKTVAGEKLNVSVATGAAWGRLQYIEVDA